MKTVSTKFNCALIYYINAQLNLLENGFQHNFIQNMDLNTLEILSYIINYPTTLPKKESL